MNLSDMAFLEPWIAAGSDAAALEAELKREVGSDHPLRSRRVQAVARRQDCDDVLFITLDAPRFVAVVHLTWGGRVEPRQFPRATIFPTFEEWIERGMNVDHLEFI